MVKKIRRLLVVCAMAVVLSLGFMLPSASAVPARVWVNGVALTSTQPYWVNGGTTGLAAAPAGGWNAYFNWSTRTLTLNNAVLNTGSLIPGSVNDYSLIMCESNLNLVLTGRNSLSLSTATYYTVTGVHVDGVLSVSGPAGTLDIRLTDTYLNSGASGLSATGNLTIQSGTINMDLQGVQGAVGVISQNSILFMNGQMGITTNGESSAAIFVPLGDFRMLDGKITASSVTTGNYAMGIYAGHVGLEGGEGRFSGSGSPTTAFAMAFMDNTVDYVGGKYLFTGTASALLHLTLGTSVTYNLNGNKVYVSDNINGSGLRAWLSPADGLLESTGPTTYSAFHYVMFGGSLPAEMPQTGDRSTPWLWAGIALCALSFGGWIAMRTVSLRRNTGR